MSDPTHKSLTIDALVTESQLPIVRIVGDTQTVVSGVEIDSREARAGDVFCCITGAINDGHEFALTAFDRGVRAYVVERELALPAGCVQVVVPHVRAAVGPISSVLYGKPSQKLRVVGVTGTNGKTSTAALLGHVLARSGRVVRVLGTLTGERTTPEAPRLQQQLAACVSDGVSDVVMEVSSHALALHRADGTEFELAIFTNLGRDHLDFHSTQEEYFSAKARLFDPSLSRAAVVNVDDAHGALLRDAAAIPTTPYSRSDARDVFVDAKEMSLSWRGVDIRVGVGGDFNVMNVLAACTAAAELGLSPTDIASGLLDFPGVRGRFEYVDEGQDFGVLVDYAHTPEALAQLLEAVRRVSSGRVIVIFGCGGNRDAGKRPLMGRVAQVGADVVFVTSDNPRTENPGEIIAAIAQGFDSSAQPPNIVVDREQAICEAVFSARTNDVVVIAGKGHETVQELKDHVVSFDDVAVARDAIRRRSALA